MNSHDENQVSHYRTLLARLLPILFLGAAGAALAAAMPATLALDATVTGAYDLAPVSLVAW